MRSSCPSMTLTLRMVIWTSTSVRSRNSSVSAWTLRRRPIERDCRSTSTSRTWCSRTRSPAASSAAEDHLLLLLVVAPSTGHPRNIICSYRHLFSPTPAVAPSGGYPRNNIAENIFSHSCSGALWGAILGTI